MKTKALDMLPVKECRKLNMSKANTALLSEESKFFSICNCTGSSSSALVVDEFTVPCEKSKELHDCKQIIEGLFKVTFCLEQHFSRFSLDGSDDKLSRVWVQLNGAKVAVEKAKEYMKGFCEPEFEEEESYPRDMHCIFVGADRLFLDCLIRDTCADVAVSELGSLHIRGGAEAVVMARSQIQQFVKLFKNNQSLPSEVETFIKKQFKIFVEDHADKYTMDLLLLPSSLKKELLNLAGRFEPIKTEHEVVDLTEPCDTHVTSTTSVKIEAVEVTEHTLEQTRKQAGTPVTELTNQIDLMLSDIPKEESNQEVGSIPCQESSDSQEKLPCKRRYSGSEGRLRKRPYSVEQSQCSPLKLNDSTDLEDSLLELDCSSESDSSVIFVEDWVDVKPEKEYKILVDFFKTMGYSQDLVEQVIKRVGQLEEPLLLLEHIEKESKKCQGRTEIHSDISDSLDYSSEIYSGNKLQTRAVGVNTECRAKTSTLAAKEEMTDVKCSTSRPQENSSSDGTCKSSSAAVSNSMGSAIPKNSKTVVNLQCSPVIEIDDLETDGASFPSCTAQNSKVDFKERTEFIARGSSSSACRHSDQVLVETAAVGQKSAVPEREHSSRPTEKYQVAVSRPSDQQSIEEHELLHQEPIIYSRPPIKRPLQVQDSVITGSQRFFDLIKTPYNLKLRNEPGKPYLKHIIIDGSNVAMAFILLYRFHGDMAELTDNIELDYRPDGVTRHEQTNALVEGNNVTTMSQSSIKASVNVSHFNGERGESLKIKMLSCLKNNANSLMLYEVQANNNEELNLEVAERMHTAFQKLEVDMLKLKCLSTQRQHFEVCLVRNIIPRDFFTPVEEQLIESIMSQQQELCQTYPELPLNHAINNMLDGILVYERRLLQQKRNKMDRDIRDFRSSQVFAWPRFMNPLRQFSNNINSTEPVHMQTSELSQPHQQITENDSTYTDVISEPERTQVEATIHTVAMDKSTDVLQGFTVLADVVMHHQHIAQRHQRAGFTAVGIMTYHLGYWYCVEMQVCVDSVIIYMLALSSKIKAPSFPEEIQDSEFGQEEQLFLTQLKELGVLSFTPARTVCGERIAAHDDRFLLHLSEKTQGIIVTNDNLKEFVIESPIWKHIIKTRLLQFTFAGDIFMLPDDPLGRHGPNLEQFLCNEDYARTCPPTHSVMMHGGNARSENPTATSSSLPLCTPNALLLAASNQFGSQFSQVRPEMRQFPLQYQAVAPTALQQPPPQRSAKETEILKQALLRIFPENQQKQKIDKILTSNPYMRDMNALSAMILD
ncbi:NEDD4-binding protein 1 [Protopterus annectens]|uniref:NEDD4-binding protein 1 n=1 Tax=Protopterus annectens TaxID=7888 RepID=UPI001CFC3A70|nr:NEDD4-binding protein 1 [Protopterus annectens]